MIAVIERKYSGIKTFDPRYLLAGTQGLLLRFIDDDRGLLEKILREPIVYVDNPLYHDPGCVDQIAARFDYDDPSLHRHVHLLALDLFTKADQRPSPATAYQPLGDGQENELFVKLNFARFQIARLLQARRNRMLTYHVARTILRWRKAELQLRNQIAQANVPLVLAMARQRKPGNVEFNDLVAEGNLALLRSVDRFDATRGFKFSTYACRSILKSFARSAFQVGRYRKRFPLEFEPGFEKSTYLDLRRESLKRSCLSHLRSLLAGPGCENLLSPIEQQILRARYALDPADGETPRLHQTLEEVGKIVGLSKERVRQIQAVALKKLRLALDEHVLNG